VCQWVVIPTDQYHPPHAGRELKPARDHEELYSRRVITLRVSTGETFTWSRDCFLECTRPREFQKPTRDHAPVAKLVVTLLAKRAARDHEELVSRSWKTISLVLTKLINRLVITLRLI